jgi:NAD(P)-dependent dehydrogenase (short-subunit alcohol dehydrogenase family)
MDVGGAVALVTGGNGGLGQRICHALAKEGVHIAVMYAQSQDQAEGVARELTSRHQINAAAFACDITDSAAVERVVGDVTGRFGRLDILVNDAAYNKAIPFPDLDSMTMEEWDKIIAINLTGPMRLIKAVAPVMKAQGRGRIVNISSVSGIGPTGSSIAYAVSKAGLIHLTRCMAVALAPETLVNCVAPGLLEGTRATANLRPEFIERSASTSLLKRAADKDDCADMVVTMCRTETTTGQTVVIDSGRYFIDGADSRHLRHRDQTVGFEAWRHFLPRLRLAMRRGAGTRQAQLDEAAMTAMLSPANNV